MYWIIFGGSLLGTGRRPAWRSSRLLILVVFAVLVQSADLASRKKANGILHWRSPSRRLAAFNHFLPKRSVRSSSSASARRFNASEHEVPSGPNPISNR